MQSPDPSSTLGEEDRLSLWVGRVARVHAGLEYNLSNVHHMLCRHDDVGPGIAPSAGFEQLAGDCLRLLRRASLSPNVITAGGEALSAARAASAERNRVVHDMWLPDPLREAWDPPRWNVFRRWGGLAAPYDQSTLLDLDAVVDAHTELARTRLRVSGLFMALHAEWPASPGLGRRAPHESELSRYIALMNNQFILQANGDFEVSPTG